MIAATVFASVRSATWRAARLTLIVSGGSLFVTRSRTLCQYAVWRHAVSSAHVPIGTMRPVSSANGMNVGRARAARVRDGSSG